ncbi:Uncharacterised protein [Campylobacter jejuni subsp. doylei]|nr:Uncharacterised protein [Campylobacter jejuni subsp. doylei]
MKLPIEILRHRLTITTHSYQFSKSHLLRCYDLRKGVRGREVSLELTNGQATALMYHQNFFCFFLVLFFFSRAYAYANFFIFLYIFYIFRGLSKPYVMGSSEILRGETIDNSSLICYKKSALSFHSWRKPH